MENTIITISRQYGAGGRELAEILAKKLLRQTTLTVGEVASRSGFQDQAYFCRVFKKATGVNPGKLRQR